MRLYAYCCTGKYEMYQRFILAPNKICTTFSGIHACEVLIFGTMDAF